MCARADAPAHREIDNRDVVPVFIAYIYSGEGPVVLDAHTRFVDTVALREPAPTRTSPPT